MNLKEPLVVAPVATLIACSLVFVVDPTTGVYPPCPSQLILGVDCPACGGLRATSSLLHGDIGSFLDHNVLLAIVFPVLVLTWVLAVWRKLNPHTRLTLQRVVNSPALKNQALKNQALRSETVRRSLWVGGVLILVVFTVTRNIFPYLGSGIG
jgi:hypothetical protein